MERVGEMERVGGIGLTDIEKERLREISIHSIIGIDCDRRRIGLPCPIHGGRSCDSFFLYSDNSYHCFKCESHGHNAIDFMQAITGKSFIDSCIELLPYL